MPKLTLQQRAESYARTFPDWPGGWPTLIADSPARLRGEWQFGQSEFQCDVRELPGRVSLPYCSRWCAGQLAWLNRRAKAGGDWHQTEEAKRKISETKRRRRIGAL